MPVRRDLIVLGAVAAAVLLGIVVFAGASGVKTQPAEPTPTVSSGPERPLFGGSLEPRVRYRTRVFAPPLSFVAGDTEWLVEDATQRSHLVVERRIRTGQPGGELPSRSAVEFSRIFGVIDPKTGRPGLAPDLWVWMRHHPDLVVGRRTPVTVSGVRGERFDVTVRFSRPARSAAACRPLLVVCTLIAPGRFYPNGTRMRTTVLPVGTAPLVIDVVGRTRRDLDTVEAPAADLLRSLRIEPQLTGR